MGSFWALCLSIWLKLKFAVLVKGARTSRASQVVDTEMHRHQRHGQPTGESTCDTGSSLGLYNTKSPKLSWSSCCYQIRKRLRVSYWGHIQSFIFAGMYLDMYKRPRYCLQISQWNVGYEAEYFHENTKSAKQSLKHTLKLIESTRTCSIMVKYLDNNNVCIQKITAKQKCWKALLSLTS